MKRQSYLVLGYGIPRKIERDWNYQVYLRVVFNSIYADSRNQQSVPEIVLSGGPTDMVKPYHRTEAAEMEKVFWRMLLALPPSARRHWLLRTEKMSISTLENLLCYKRRFAKKNVVIFCEQTRVARIRTLAKWVLGKSTRVEVRGIDFDASSNRFLDPAYIARKERATLRFDRWALRKPSNLSEHHRVFKERIRRLRGAGSKGHVRAVKEWWDSVLREFESIE